MDKESLPWRPWERYVILAYSEHNDDLAQQVHNDDEQLTSADVDNRVDFVDHAWKPVALDSATECSTSLEQSLNELQLMKVELRGRGVGEDDVSDDGQRLLYLGDVHTDRTQRPYYRPQSYQQPLVADDATRVRRRGCKCFRLGSFSLSIVCALCPKKAIHQSHGDNFVNS